MTKKKKKVNDALPSGWKSTKHVKGNGSTYQVFTAPSGNRYRSMVAVMRAIESGTEASNTPPSPKKKKKKTPKKSNVEVIWVQCDGTRCQKWRQIPKPEPGETLPTKWYCRMNTHDPSRASCDAPEDSTHESESVSVSTATATFQRGVFTRALRVRIRVGDDGKVRDESKQRSLDSILDAMQPVKPLKPGWTAIEHIRNGNKKYFHYIGPNGAVHRSYVICYPFFSF